MQKDTILKKMTWLKDQRRIGRFKIQNKHEDNDLSTIINQVILALGKREPLTENRFKQKHIVRFNRANGISVNVFGYVRRCVYL